MMWDDSYNVRIDSLDHQHRELLRMINELDGALCAALPGIAAASNMKKLVRQFREHFRTEEHLFTKFAYPEGPLHSLQHDTFVRNLNDFQERLERGSLAFTQDITRFIGDWFVNHMTKIDMRYSEYLLTAMAGVKVR